MSRNSWRSVVVLLLLVANLLYFFWPRTSVTVPVAGPGVEKLELYRLGEPLSVAPAVPFSVTRPVLESESESVAAETLARTCWELGPLPGAALSSLRRVIDSQSLDGRLLKRTVVSGEDYRVTIGPAAEGRSREVLKQSLQSMGIDSYMIADDEHTGKLSLGLFSSPARAENLLALVAGSGMTASIHRRQRLRDEFWLIVGRSSAVAVGWGADFAHFRTR